MTIYLLVEGDTETALRDKLKEFLDQRAALENKPKTQLKTIRGMTFNKEAIRDRVEATLKIPGAESVIGLIDVYPNFRSADHAKRYLREAVGANPRFFAHAAQYDVEAWLLPFWDDICRRVGMHVARPGAHPEAINDQQPPSKRLSELYRRAKPKPIRYIKPVEMTFILRGKDLTVAANQCPELKALLNTLLSLNGLSLL